MTRNVSSSSASVNADSTAGAEHVFGVVTGEEPYPRKSDRQTDRPTEVVQCLPDITSEHDILCFAGPRKERFRGKHPSERFHP